MNRIDELIEQIAQELANNTPVTRVLRDIVNDTRGMPNGELEVLQARTTNLLRERGIEAPQLLVERTFADRNLDALIAAMNDRYAFVVEGKEARILELSSGERLPVKTIAHKEANNLITVFREGKPRQISLFESWFKSPQRREYEGLDLAPPPRELREGFYNLWRGFAVVPDPEPEPAARCRLFLEHTENVIAGDLVAYEYVMNWLAFAVQQPGEPAGVALVLRGKQGSGKGVFAQYFGQLFGDNHYLQITSVDRIVGNFNAQLSGRVVLFADEVEWNRSRHAAGVLKGLITEKTIQIEPKRIDTRTEPNCLHVIMASNENFVVPADLRDRRLCVLDVPETRIDDVSYFEALFAEAKNGGREALLAVLQARDISQFKIREFPRTSGLRSLQEMSLKGVQRWWYQRLLQAVDETWIATESTSELWREYQEWAGRTKDTTKTDWSSFVPTVIGLSGAERCVTRNPETGKQYRGLQFPRLGACRKQFDSMVGTPGDWEGFPED